MCSDSLRHTDESASEDNEKAIILYKNADEIMRINVLHKGFNIHNQPKNYMNFRTSIEEIIYHAVRADIAKSPYTSFKISNKYISVINDFDVLTDARSLKALVKMIFDSSIRTSTVRHRVGDLFLFDEFGIDSFILTSSSYIYLNGAEFTRHALTMRDLYINFLYHTVGPNNSFVGDLTQNIIKSGSGSSNGPVSNRAKAIVSSSPLELAACNVPPNSSSDNPSSEFNRNADDFLRLAKWKIDDLSFLVGSDLAIFGTKNHPCISLRLNSLREPINVLTGIDMWLENILNEVPKVAMCFHNEGIVMQEYELYNTTDLPKLTGFDKDHILRIMRNLAMFLKNNATQEGHTYWLVKEAGFDVVKLYDLTVLCDKSNVSNAYHDFESDKEGIESVDGSSGGVNPFILPVATLCFKLAEHRVSQRDRYLKQQATNPSVIVRTRNSGAGRQESMDDYLTDLRAFLTDVLRLLKNCLNLIGTMEEGAGEAYEHSQALPGSRSSSPGRPPSLRPYADLKSRALLLLCRLYLSTPPEDIIVCASLVLKPTPAAPEMVSVSVAEFAKESGAAPDVMNAVYPPTSTRSPPPQASPGSVQTSPLKSSKRRTLRLGDSIIEAFRSPQTDRVSILTTQLTETLRPALPYVELGLDLGGSGGGTKADAPALVAVAGGEGTERWKRWRAQATEMLPFVVVKQAVVQACRLWSRVFPLGISPDTVTPAKCRRLHECSQLVVSALFHLEHLAPQGSCRFCGQQSLSAPDGASPAYQLGVSARRFFVHLVLGLQEARSRGASLQSIPDAAVKVSRRSFLNLTLARVCPKASLLLLPVLRVMTSGLGGSLHVCREADTCMYSIPTACMLNTWLRTLDLVVDYLNQLIPLAFSTAATPVAVDDTSRFLPDIRLPSYLSFALNEFMLALRIYGSNFPDMEPSIKVAAVKAPEILQPSKALVEAEGHPLPPILQYLGMAIDALAPSFSVLSATDLCSSQIDLGPFVKLILDVLRTANEYFVYGLKELAANETPSLWLVNNIASVQHKVEKLLPFQLNNLLSTDLLQLGASSARRKAASGDICYRLLHGYLGPLDVRMIISFRLHMVKISVFSKQLANTHYSNRFVTTISEQLKVSLTWLQRHLSICGGCGDADCDDAQLKYEDYKLVISIVTDMVLIQSVQKDILSESGIQHILRDAVILRRVVDALHDYLTKAEIELLSKLLSKELLPPLLQLGKTLYYLCLSLYLKVCQPSVKSSVRRNRKRMSDSGSRSVEALYTLRAAMHLPASSENLDHYQNLLLWTRLVQTQLTSVETYLNAR
ncbi:Erythroid differentiation-related factor 1 [Echinococcus granulosus]|nr:Erythroid differentiation-related factor 1 [Echinococcus granulosus]